MKATATTPSPTATSPVSSHAQEESMSPWNSFLPELRVSILEYLPTKDLLSCRRLDKRNMSFIDENRLLSNAFWRCHPFPPAKELYSQDALKNSWKPWLNKKESEDIKKMKSYSDFHKILFYAVSKIKEKCGVRWKEGGRLCLSYRY